MEDQPSTVEVMAESLATAGVSHIFAYPGDPIIELLEGSRRRGLEIVLARREGTAGFMAEGLAQSTGRPGVCLSTLGPGSTALVNCVAAATLDRLPMIAISGQIESTREQFFTHQVIDHKLLYSPITKWAGRVEAGSAATTMRKAFRLATAERPGAVHLTIAADTSSAPSSDPHFVMPPAEASVETISVLRAAGAGDPLSRIAAAGRPVILAGIGAVRAGATAALVRYAELTSTPVVVSPMSKGVFPEDHPLFAGVLDMACNQVLWELLASADLIVAAGFDAVELIKPWQVSTPVLHVDALPNTDQIYASDIECLGNVGAILDWFSDTWSSEPRWEEAEIERHRRRLRDAYYAGRVVGDLNPTDVVDVVRAASPRDTIAASDVGSHKLLIGQGWQTYAPRELLMTNGLSTMGFGIPAAIAAKLSHPDRPVVALVGDGGFAMACTELRLAASLHLGIAVVVFVDGSLNRIELKQMARGYPSTATRIEDMDLVTLASAMECDGARATSAAEIEKALVDVERLTRPLVIEARVNPSQYESQF